MHEKKVFRFGGLVSPVLLWKIFFNGLALVIGVGLLIEMVGFLFGATLYISLPFLAVVYCVVGIATYPVTILLRHFGFHHRSFFKWGVDLVRHPAKRTFVRTVAPELTNRRQVEPNDDSKPTHISKASDERPDPWKLLELTPGASKEAIVAAYRRKMSTNHPDKVANLDPELQSLATKRTAMIVEAYEVLMGR